MALTVVGTNYGVSAGSITQSHSFTDADALVILITHGRNASAERSAGQVTVDGVTYTQVGTTQSNAAGRFDQMWIGTHPGVGSFDIVSGDSGTPDGDRSAVCVFEISGDTGTPTFDDFFFGLEVSGNTADCAITGAGGADLILSWAQHGSATANSYTPDSGQSELFDSAPAAGVGSAAGYTIGGSQADWTATAGSGTLVILAALVTEATGGTTVNATGDDAAIAAAAGQAVPSLTIQATGSGIGIAAAAGQATTAGVVSGAGSGASVVAVAGQAVPSGTVGATGSDAAIAMDDGTVTPVTGVEVQATGSGIGIAVASGQATLASTVLAAGSGVTILAAAGQAFVPGTHILAPADRTFYDEAFDSTFADESASMTFAD